MSQTRDSVPFGTGKQRTIRLPNDRLAKVELTNDRDYVARLDVMLEDRRWVFGVEYDFGVEYLYGLKDGKRSELDVPDWMDYVIEDVGLGRVEV